MNECKCKECGKVFTQFESVALENKIYCSYWCEEINKQQLDLFKINVKSV